MNFIYNFLFKYIHMEIEKPFGMRRKYKDYLKEH